MVTKDKILQIPFFLKKLVVILKNIQCGFLYHKVRYWHFYVFYYQNQVTSFETKLN